MLLITLVIEAHPISECRNKEDPICGTGSYHSRRRSVSLAMICCCWHCSLIAVLFKPPTSNQSYHRSIDQKTSVRTQKSSSGPGKFNGMLYLSLLYMLLSHGDMYFVVQSTSFVAKCIQDVAFIVKACHLEH